MDDEQAVLDLTEKALTLMGYTVLKARSGEEAMEIYRRRRNDVDLIIMDIGMPGMGGAACKKELLELDPCAKIIMASGYSAHTRDGEPTVLGAFLRKPYKLDEMLRMVRSLLTPE